MTVDQYGVLIHVRDGRVRDVPVLADWENLIAEQAQRVAPNAYLFRPERTTTHRNTVTNFADRTSQYGLRFNTQRGRVTWIRTQLSAGVPVKALITAAGVESLEALTRYLPYLPQANQQEMRAIMRAGRRR